MIADTVYDFNSSSVLRTYANTYLNATACTSLYMRNRLLTSSVTETGGGGATLVTNAYDYYPGNTDFNCYGSGMTTAYTPREFDSNFTTSVTVRGNVTQ